MSMWRTVEPLTWSSVAQVRLAPAQRSPLARISSMTWARRSAEQAAHPK
jgi:hypothetical protein